MNTSFIKIEIIDLDTFTSKMLAVAEENQQENDVEINAYDIEKAIKEFLKTREPKLLSQLKFDCESSLFCVQTDDLKNLTKLNEALLIITADDVIRKEYLKIGT